MNFLGKFKKIKSNPELLKIIEEDMLSNGGIYTPSSHWSDVNRKYIDIKKKKGLLDMLDDLIGSQGSALPTDDFVKMYKDLFEVIDSKKFSSKLDKYSLLTEHGSVMDINLIRIFSSFNENKQTKILEIGGGYGRLAEIFMSNYKHFIKYVLVDAVPVSIMYSYLYLKSVFPRLRIGFYYINDIFDLDNYDIYIIPSWHFSKLNRYKYDIGVNIESMQEMNQGAVDMYMKLLNKVIRVNGCIYLSNAHDYIFKGDWKYPASWQCVFRYNTPRSWTIDHPTEIYLKTNSDFSEANNTIMFFSHVDSKTKVELYGIPGHILKRNQL